MPPTRELDEFMSGPDAEFDGTLRGAWQVWRETGRAYGRRQEWRDQSMTNKPAGRIEDIRAATEQLFAVAQSNGLEILEDWPQAPGAVAEFVPAELLIVLAPDHSEEDRMVSLAHEMGHYMDPWLQANWEWYDRHDHEGDIEIVAQMAAAIFADWYDIDLTGNTDGYLSHWAVHSRSRRDKNVGELLERASISGLSLLPQTEEVAYELDRARQRLSYRNATSGFLGRFFRSERREQELGIIDCSNW